MRRRRNRATVFAAIMAALGMPISAQGGASLILQSTTSTDNSDFTNICFPLRGRERDRGEGRRCRHRSGARECAQL